MPGVTGSDTTGHHNLGINFAFTPQGFRRNPRSEIYKRHKETTWTKENCSPR